MSTVLFIDANIYLRFYDTKAHEMSSLLKTLEQSSDDIFITTQITDEVNRNKLACALRSFKLYSDIPAFKKASLPVHYESSEIDAWNQKINQMDSLKNDQSKIIIELLDKISNSSDNISLTLKKLFDKAAPVTSEELDLARSRKETGNPPGKYQDTLGDQLSWEQLQNKIKPSDNLILISHDKDYLVQFENKCFLNPLLVADLVKRGFHLDRLYCYGKLVDGLKKYKEIGNTAIPFPNDADAERISDIEQTIIISSATLNSATVCASSLSSGFSGSSGYSGPSGYGKP